ncbi:UNVERIFIED_CONTAM: protein PECTIC ARABINOGALACTAN SYNTHESIS-RELATED, partial [Sesamum radiatum]
MPHYLFPNDDLHRSHPHRSKISIVILVAVVFAAVFSVTSVVRRLNAPYLCRKDGITLHCPHVKEPPSLWENPYSATTSWKPCAERREGIISDLPAENETNGYIFIHAEGGLNQQRIADGSHLWALALQKRKEGRCPLEPGEVAVMLRAMGYPKETQIYVASGQVYGGQNRMAPLRNMFPNLVTKEELATKLELDGFRKHVTSLAALDFLVCLKSDVF